MAKYGYAGRWSASVYPNDLCRWGNNCRPIGSVRRAIDPRAGLSRNNFTYRPASGAEVRSAGWEARLTAHPGIIGTGKTRDAAVDDAYRQVNNQPPATPQQLGGEGGTT